MSTLAELNSLKDAKITELSEENNNLKKGEEIKEKLIKKNPEENKIY